MSIRDFFDKARPVILISRDVCRQASKERMMYGFLLLALLFILMANVPFMVDDPRAFHGEKPETAALQIGFMSINIFTLLIAIFTCVNTLQNYLARDRLVLLLSKPVARWQVLEGVVLGLFEIVFMTWCLMTGGVWLVIVSQAKVTGLFVWSGMSVTALLALFYVTLVVFLYCIIPNVLSGVLAIFFIIAGFGASLAQDMFATAPVSPFARQALLAGLQVLPKINELLGVSMKTLGFFDVPIRPWSWVGHTLALCAVLNLAGCWKFRNFFQRLT